MGLLLFFVSSAAGMTKDKLIESIKVDITADPPFEIVGAADDIIKIVKGLLDWINGFIKG